MTKSQRIEKEITKTKEQLATIQAKLKKYQKNIKGLGRRKTYGGKS